MIKGLLESLALAVLLVTLAPALAAQDDTAPPQDHVAAGRAALEAGRLDAAIQAFSAALQKDEKNFDARYGLAKAHFEKGEASTAVFHGVRAEKLKPDDLATVELVGSAFSVVGRQKMAASTDPSADFEEAILSFRKAAALAPTDARYPAWTGWLHRMLGRYEESAASYLAAAEVDPKDPWHPYEAAVSYGYIPDAERAEAAVDRGLEVAPGSAPLLLMKGQIRQSMADNARASALYRQVLAAPEATDDAMRTAAQGLWNLHGVSAEWPQLVAAFEVALKEKPKAGVLWWWLGYTRLASGETDAARQAFERLEKIGPGWAPEAQLYLGKIALSEGKLDRAVDKLVAAAKSDYVFPVDGEQRPVHQLRSVVGSLYAQGKLAEAIELGEKVVLPLVTDPTDEASVRQDLGFFLRELGAAKRGSEGKKAFERSRTYYEQAVALIPTADRLSDEWKAKIENDAGLMYQYYDVKDLDRAIAHYREALAWVPNHDDSLLNWGRIHIEAGRYQDAIDLLEKGSRADVQVELQRARSLLKARER